MSTRCVRGFLLGCLIFSGCQRGIFLKRESELNCPTDIRKTVPWSAGEDAIFCCPCAPDGDFYGHKPTCWGVWPAPAAQWREAHCGPLAQDLAVVMPDERIMTLLPPPAKSNQSIQLTNPSHVDSEYLPGPAQAEPSPTTDDQSSQVGPGYEAKS